jgi:micrococcal nuclease
VFRAENPRLIDADTLDVDVDLGFQVWTRRRLRLAKVDAPESGSPEGRAAKNFVLSQLTRAQTLVLRTTKIDLHGRYVADLFLSPHEIDIDECYRKGTHLNALLVSAGHAVAVG